MMYTMQTLCIRFKDIKFQNTPFRVQNPFRPIPPPPVLITSYPPNQDHPYPYPIVTDWRLKMQTLTQTYIKHGVQNYIVKYTDP